MLLGAQSAFVVVLAHAGFDAAHTVGKELLQHLYNADATKSVLCPLRISRSGWKAPVALVAGDEAELACDNAIIGTQAKEAHASQFGVGSHERAVKGLGAGPVPEMTELPMLSPLIIVHADKCVELRERVRAGRDRVDGDGEAGVEKIPGLPECISLFLRQRPSVGVGGLRQIEGSELRGYVITSEEYER